MRIIAGERRGLVLHDFDMESVRPTKDLVKESVFNMIATRLDISVANVLDLYAGTGGLGIEALSRGALRAVFVEKEANAADLIRRNLKKAGFENRAEVIEADVFKILSSGAEKFELIFADPPYALLAGKSIAEAVVTGNQLRPGGLLIVECSPGEEIPEIKGLSLEKSRIWGDSKVTIFVNRV